MSEGLYGWLVTAVAEFGRASKVKLSGGGSPEASVRGPLEALLKVVGERLPRSFLIHCFTTAKGQHPASNMKGHGTFDHTVIVWCV
ncbi:MULTISPECIES: hypothetical protein [unclassified Streptomyces]|uniref:hypothetical protein n=1 Tax=unclassified Streptomyces TaxID=2593676 RepID=UPI0011AFF94D|nr:hypothetical protein [Streptomyces sp. SM10]